MAPGRARKVTVRQSLEVLGINDAAVFGDCDTRDEEFSRVIKKTYFRMVLRHHPDKGGDAEMFRDIQTAFELLRDLHHGKRTGDWMFHECMDGKTAAAPQDTVDEEFDMSGYDADFSNMETPSWEYYETAAEETVPIYRMELAKSGRSRCKQKGKTAKRCSMAPDGVDETCTDVVARTEPEFIMQGEVRIGSIDESAGKYGRWNHLRCWRVPYKVWLGLPDPDKCQEPENFATALASMNLVLVSGFSELPQDVKDNVVRYVMNKGNWARKTTKKAKKKPADAEAPAGAETAKDEAPSNQQTTNAPAVSSSSMAIVASGRKRFVMPVPGKNGAKTDVLSGKTFVMTGIFPEAGGGMGLDQGKDKVKAMIKAFGGRVTGSISGKTDVLIVGKDPGFSKVSKARASDKIVLMGLKEIADGLDNGFACLDDFEEREPMLIKGFSGGYMGKNGLALLASAKDLAIAQGVLSEKKVSKKAVAFIEDAKKPAAKRQPLKEADTNRQVKKRRTSKPAKGKGSSALVVAKPTKKKAAKKTTRKKAAKTKDEEIMKIACDACGEDCTKRSWFVPGTEEDFCIKCHGKNPRTGAVPQAQGKMMIAA